MQEKLNERMPKTSPEHLEKIILYPTGMNQVDPAGLIFGLSRCVIFRYLFARKPAKSTIFATTLTEFI